MLNIKAVSLSLALSMEALYFACILIFYLIPSQALYVLNTWIHIIDLERIASPFKLTLLGFIVGFLSIFVSSYISGALFAAVYNAISRKTA